MARLSQVRDADDPDLLAARRDLKAARLEDHIRRLVDEATPLTETQRARLAALLLPARRPPQREAA